MLSICMFLLSCLCIRACLTGRISLSTTLLRETRYVQSIIQLYKFIDSVVQQLHLERIIETFLVVIDSFLAVDIISSYD